MIRMNKTIKSRDLLFRLPLVWLISCVAVGGWLISMGASPKAVPSHKLTTKAIEDVKVGDFVLAKDPSNLGPPKRCKVLELPRSWSEHVVHIQLNGGGELQATREHPFWIPQRGWVRAREIQSGDQLQDEFGSPVVVTGVRIETRTVDTFNLIVEGVHTYYAMAGDTCVLVHNGYGSYTNTHASGTVYVGKGDAARAARSAAEKAAQYGDPLVNTNWSPGISNEDSFLQEEFRMRDAMSKGTPMYNKINSPGNKIARRYGCP